ncbi:hypothetical protein Q1695_014043 [Nippostrongylus brasiliensis]|nr:hypothetical protein Q1695_014043 [Nippostrongylus brasiliensis]
MATKPRYDWFQTDTCVTVTVLKKGVSLSDCRVTFNDNHVKIYAGDNVIFETTLARPVDENNFTVTCTPSKVEVRMPKKTPGHWTMLGASATEETLPSEPYHPSRNWEAIEREEENEPLEGQDAVNRIATRNLEALCCPRIGPRSARKGQKYNRQTVWNISGSNSEERQISSIECFKRPFLCQPVLIYFEFFFPSVVLARYIAFK